MYSTPEELMFAVDLYIELCKAGEEVPTFAGATLFLGFTHKKQMYEQRAREGFSDSVDKLKTYVESFLEVNCTTGRGSTAGSVFLLKTTHGHQDKQVVEHKGLEVTISGAWADV